MANTKNNGFVSALRGCFYSVWINKKKILLLLVLSAASLDYLTSFSSKSRLLRSSPISENTIIKSQTVTNLSEITGFMPYNKFLLVIPKNKNNAIAVGGAITSSKVNPNASKTEFKRKFPLFNMFLNSFCRTCSPGFSYHFYFGYDNTDPFFTNNTQLQIFTKEFNRDIVARCPKHISTTLHLLKCNHSKKPAWAQNDAMMEAYLDNMEYFYRVNDDSLLQTGKWTEVFIEKLAAFHPPNVGVVGPWHHGGNEQILTYDFTHHTHHHIFGFHYPRDFMGE